MALGLDPGIWAPIESAPKNGTRVDLWVERYYIEDHSKPDVEYEGMRIADCYWNENAATGLTGWHTYEGGKYLEHSWSVTHWMPIPDGPVK